MFQKEFNTKSTQSEIVQMLVKYNHFRMLEREYIADNLPDAQLIVQLIRAILLCDESTVVRLAQETPYQFLNEGTRLERRAYYALQGLQVKLEQAYYADYLRMLTPVLVDVFRIAIETSILPELQAYIIPIAKEKENHISLYRGVQWSKEKIESSENLVHKTFQHYYADRFNYQQYVSSSHLLKIIELNSKDTSLIEAATQLRQAEKYLRNLAAHELIPVDKQYFQERMGYSPQQLHNKLENFYDKIGLKHVNQRQSIPYLKTMLVKQLSV